MAELPEEYKTTVPSGENAEEVVALIVACQLADTGEEDMSLDELIDDWHELDLATEAVVVVAPDGRIAGYADVISRSYVTVSVYGYVHPDHRERGIGAFLVAWGERWTRDHIPQAPDNARRRTVLRKRRQRGGAQTPRIRRLRAGARGVHHGDRTR